ncbi:MAG TPA: peptidoglycan DD-metalloendopeptidase family protein [Steroidobacteraceae bacterium]|nr:peptidoglycan DD-metalloendopeptidase family protein [Steroidobacteraceae bacterium]
MRISRSICTIGLCCLALGACADIPRADTHTYVVRPDDTLYSIAWRHDLDFRDLARWNNLGADFHISVGQVLVLAPGVRAPDVPRVSPAPRAGTAPQVSTPRAPSPHIAAPPAGAASSRVPQSAGNGTMRWVWPTDRLGAPRPVPGGGILLSGRLGQDVRAAAAGRVVYTGSGLRGYGNLIIIKHADNLLSAYAHNRELLVHDGQDVAVGQVIAYMGEGPNQTAILYFELRQNGKPIDPVPLLPK